ncbi:hypothetical protein PybrP1_009966, partial [[Pythium] brassicae (nom. inval.)]
MRTAVRLNRVDMLQCIAELRELDPSWQWERNLMADALSSFRRDLRVLDWLYQHLPQSSRTVYHQQFRVCASRGDVTAIRWLCEHDYAVGTSTADSAANSRQLEVLAYLYEHTTVRCSSNGVCEAASNGNIEVLELILVDQPQETNAIDGAANGGRLSIVKYLHDHLTSGCTKRAMDSAAMIGRLDIVKFLHENRTEGCTTNAMNVTEFGRLEALRFLHENRNEGCTARALEAAAANNHLEVMEFLCAHRHECDYGSAMVSAAASGQVTALQFLLKYPDARASAYLA